MKLNEIEQQRGKGRCWKINKSLKNLLTAQRAAGPNPTILAAAQQNPAGAEVWRKDCTLPVHQSPGSARAIHLDSKLFNIQSKEKRSSWTYKRNRTSFSAEFRGLCIETGRDDREYFLAGTG